MSILMKGIDVKGSIYHLLYYVRIPPEDARPPWGPSPPRFTVTPIPKDGV